MERSLFLFLAIIGYLVGGLVAAGDGGALAAVILGAASTFLLIWAIALGVHLGIKDAVSELGGSTREEADRWLKSRYGSDVIDPGRPPKPQRNPLPPNGS
ncbi:hypothetical protein ABIE44_000266 [Marmoricola sp. OAE513]|uniref:hypothetical protein n=1 Tax=Marmoricola sp. OAE513 TaxID=2817894 RepID=UPI001AE6526F